MIAFATAIFISAFLIFQVQPLLGKYILPWFGGTPAVWTTCMLFFQVLLLGGYAYAHLSIKKFKPRTQFIVHACLLGLSLVFLPIEPRAFWKPQGGEAPAFHILLLLCATVGLPYIALSATGPLLQAWFGRAYPQKSPYALYALSNIGSLLGLLSFPFVFEPIWGRHDGAVGWSVGFAVFALLCAGCAWMAYKSGARDDAEKPLPQLPPRPVHRVFWIALPAVASTLLLAVTNQMCIDVASIPFLWVIPLCVYLLSFIITFAGKFWYRRWVCIFGLVATLLFVPTTLTKGAEANMAEQIGDVAGWFMANKNAGLDFGLALNQSLGGSHQWIGGEPSITHAVSPIGWQIGVWTALLFFSCMVLHGEVYRLKPGVSRLTSFYLAISIGGALGGVFVGLIAPAVFRMYLELHIALVAMPVLILLCLWLDKTHWMHATPLQITRWWTQFRGRKFIDDDAPVWARIRYFHLVFVPMISAIVVLGGEMHRHTQHYMGIDVPEGGGAPSESDVIYAGRNFYGVLRVREYIDRHNGPETSLTHGVILHGMQFKDAAKRRWHTTYYASNSGIGIALRCFPRRQQRVGMVGLGAGTITSYGKPGDYYRIYEINAEVVKLAKSYFTYLGDCEAKYEIVLGDARVMMEHEAERKEFQDLDVLALDAFSSDAIPVHLLTREAFELYFKHLAPDGVLAVHISNRHLDLKPVVYGLAREFKYKTSYISNPSNDYFGVSGSHWVLVTRNEELLANEELREAEEFPEVKLDGVRLWTDDFSNLLQVMTK
ncbi:MAG: fused MFS/spermidine synthase [Planctomycetes bacterium]|nr:fused MFS/spermidine synthase [Planctomycetota bacterium]